MDMISVVSSNLAEIGYDEETQTLGIIFKNGVLYHYSNVPESVFEELKSAGSAGQYFNSCIRDDYTCQKVG